MNALTKIDLNKLNNSYFNFFGYWGYFFSASYFALLKTSYRTPKKLIFT